MKEWHQQLRGLQQHPACPRPQTWVKILPVQGMGSQEQVSPRHASPVTQRQLQLV